MKKKILFFIFLIFLFLLLCASTFLIGKQIFTGSTIEEKNQTDYSSVIMDSPSDKDSDCFELQNGKIACKVGSVEIPKGSVREDDFKVETHKN